MQNIFTTPETVYHKVARKLKGETINKYDIEEMCFHAEANYLADAEMLGKFVDFEIEIDKTTRQGLLPCNILRLVEVYNENEEPISYSIIGVADQPSRIKIDESDLKVYVSYIGINVDENGLPLIRTSHIDALEAYCIKELIEADVLIGKKPFQLLERYEMKFSNMVVGLKQNWDFKDHQTHNKIDAIRYNMIPVAARRRLLHKTFE